ncbi:MAG: adenine deaminase C-terminal domain-containing protein, partial [Candidatus Hodarchaeota archaeon]
IHEGQIVAKNGELLKHSPSPEVPPPALETIKVPEISKKIFQIPSPSTVKDGTIMTRVLSLPKPPALPFPEIIKEEIPIDGSILDTEGYTAITVLNRYKDRKQPPSRGLIRGYPINDGALASTVAHDSHNFTVLGSNVSNMIIVAKKVIEMNGGLAASKNGKILASIALPVGGLMSNTSLKELCKSAERFRNALDKLGLDPSNPIMPFALFSLPAVPGAKVTDLGIWDDKQKKLVPIFI